MERYCNLSHLPALPQYIIDEALSAEYKTLFSPVRVMAVAKLFESTNFMRNIKQRYEGAFVLAEYTKNAPHSIYDWHIDSKRTCGLNWVIKADQNAMTLYKFDSDPPLPDLFKSIEEIKYQPLKPTLIKVDSPHFVMNLGAEERIILTVTVDKAEYEEFKEYLMGLNITEY
jgi:hypothetical protein